LPAPVTHMMGQIRKEKREVTEIAMLPRGRRLGRVGTSGLHAKERTLGRPDRRLSFGAGARTAEPQFVTTGGRPTSRRVTGGAEEGMAWGGTAKKEKTSCPSRG